MPGTVWGTASSVTAKFRSAPCLPLDRGKLLPGYTPLRQPALTPRRTIKTGVKQQPVSRLADIAIYAPIGTAANTP